MKLDRLTPIGWSHDAAVAVEPDLGALAVAWVKQVYWGRIPIF